MASRESIPILSACMHAPTQHIHHMLATPLLPACLSLAIQVAQLNPDFANNQGRLTYNDVIYPKDQAAVSDVASSLDIPSIMVPQMVIPGALLEERAGAHKWAGFQQSANLNLQAACKAFLI